MLRKPDILLPYPGPAGGGEQDILICLRPEYNGVLLESILLRAVERSPEYKQGFRLVYMANLPGDFISRHMVVEHYYQLQLQFATHGLALFTPYMRECFENTFKVSIDDVQIVGAFDALDILKLTPDDLFSIWVADEDMLKVSGQNIKRIQDGLFVVNYDIPSLLHRNNITTNIAVMLFRTRLGYAHFRTIIKEACASLREHKLLATDNPVGRLFHATRGPFEEIKDARGYLYQSDGQQIPLADISFSYYLESRGIAAECIQHLLEYPIGHFQEGNEYKENSIFEYTRGSNYSQALQQLQQLRSTYRLSVPR